MHDVAGGFDEAYGLHDHGIAGSLMAALIPKGLILMI